MKSAEEWAKEAINRIWDAYIRNDMDGFDAAELALFRDIQNDALEAAAGIVENYCKCRCGPEWGKRHDPACIYADGVEMAESIRELKSETKP